MLLGERVCGIDFEHACELHFRGHVVLFIEGTASGLVMFKRGVVARLVVLEAVLVVLRVPIERGFIFRHRGLEVFQDLGAVSARVCLPFGAACNVDC